MDIYTVSLKGIRNQNEDKHDVILNINGKDTGKTDINYFGVYDGHGGKFVSKFLTKHLPPILTNKNLKYPLPSKTVSSIYTQLQNTLKEQYKQYATHCGSTCLVVIQFKNHDANYLNIYNTGDSRCVLCRDNLAMALTKDHKPNWPEERIRIESLGGVIKKDRGCDDWRIKDLSVSRAFGDIDAEPYLTNTPDIFRYRMDKTDKFLIIACDGLWDILSNQEAVNFVLGECYDGMLQNRKNKNINIARKLAEYAIQKGSGDNVTIIIVFL